MPVERDALYYNMNHQSRGIAVILNHEQFTVGRSSEPSRQDFHSEFVYENICSFQIPKLKQRNGTQVDKKCLENLFKELGFEVWSYTDLEFADLQKTINRGWYSLRVFSTVPGYLCIILMINFACSCCS